MILFLLYKEKSDPRNDIKITIPRDVPADILLNLIEIKYEIKKISYGYRMDFVFPTSAVYNQLLEYENYIYNLIDKCKFLKAFQ